MISSWKKENINTFINDLDSYYKDCSSNYFQSMSFISDLNQEEIEFLNQNINLKKIVNAKDDFILHKALKNQSKNNFSFFLLRSKNIFLELKKLDKEKHSIFTLLSETYISSKDFIDPNLFAILFERGYSIKRTDIDFVLNYYKDGKVDSEEKLEKWTLVRFAVKLNDVEKFKKAYTKSREIFTILSFKMKRPVSFKFRNILEVANNAIQYYRESGEIILKAMDIYNVKNTILSLDRKKTFQRKYQEYLDNKPLQDKEFENIVSEIFEEFK